MKKIRILLLILALNFAFSSGAQSQIRLDSCISKAETHYPMIGQLHILDQNLNLMLENFNRNFWPQINVNGQYTYQSDVTGLPIQIPNMNIPKLDKNQYRVFADITQTIYDGGMNKAGKSIAMANTELEKEKVKVELYKIKEKVSQLFFGVLMVNEKLEQLKLSRLDLQTGYSKLEVSFKNGLVLESSLSIIKAEMIKLDQKIIEVRYEGSAYRKMLSLLTGENIDSTAEFLTPSVNSNDQINRPELKLFDRQIAYFYSQETLLRSKLQPKVNLFLQTGYGKPALNMLSNEPQGYYIGGLRFTIPISNFYSNNNEKGLLLAYRKSVELQRNSFLLQTSITLVQEDEEVAKFKALLQKDDELIALRTGIKEVALTQLQNGSITSSDYIREQNAEESARLGKSMHLLQLLLHSYNKQLINGN